VASHAAIGHGVVFEFAGRDLFAQSFVAFDAEVTSGSDQVVFVSRTVRVMT